MHVLEGIMEYLEEEVNLHYIRTTHQRGGCHNLCVCVCGYVVRTQVIESVY